MPTPGYDVVLVDTPIPRGAPTATDTLFVVDFAGDGPFNTPTLIQSPDEMDATFDTDSPVGWSQAQAVVDTFFALGGARLYFVRAGGSAATTGVNDDHAAITTTEWQTALDSIGADLGPGQIIMPAATTAALQALVLAHAWTRNRHAILNGPSGATDSALQTLAAANVALTSGRAGALWRDYAVVPGRAAGTRTVPWAAVQAGLIAASDQVTDNPNLEAAGINGDASTWVQSIVSPVDDTRRATLRGYQVNTAKSVYGAARAYGARTLANLTVLPHWWNVGGYRTVMAARALLAQVDEDFVFGQLDAEGQELAVYNGRLRAALKPLVDVRALYAPPRVDTGPTVNTTATKAAGSLLAKVALKTSPTAEHVITYLARVPLEATI